ncbi:MAG: LarC family nickel insertion protein [Chloroflexi bacterium]|nr:LarC family nickel insertion protein [Chloroflexota bacterium]
MQEAPDQVAEIACNLDDMTGEELGHLMETLLAAGALDVWFTPIQMKKSRPGTLLTVLCAASERERFCQLLLRASSTLGVRWHLAERLVAERAEAKVSTAFGEVRVKLKLLNGQVVSLKPEYDDCAALAQRSGASLARVREAAQEAGTALIGRSKGTL